MTLQHAIKASAMSNNVSRCSIDLLMLSVLLITFPMSPNCIQQEPVAWPSSAEAKEIAELGDESSAALAAEAAGDWKTAAELWKALTDAAEGPGRRDKQRGARFRFRYALCLLELGDKAPAARALEVSARVLRGADVRAALAATLWASGEGEKAEAYWMAATEQGAKTGSCLGFRVQGLGSAHQTTQSIPPIVPLCHR